MGEKKEEKEREKKLEQERILAEKAAKEEERRREQEEKDREAAMVPQICLPNLMFTQVRRQCIVKQLLPHQIYNHIDGINQVAMKCQLHKNIEQYAIKEGIDVNEI